MPGRRMLALLLLLSTSFFAGAQKIVYSDYDKEDTRRLDFEVIGKVDGKFLIYKNSRNRHYVSVLDNDMVQVNKVEQDYIPDNDRFINADFFPYSDFAYMIYQYQRKNIVYCYASKIDGNGNRIGEPVELDTTQIGFAANNRIYTVLTSEDKSKIGVFKINSRNKRMYMMTTLLLDDKLQTIKHSRIPVPMEERNDNLGDFHLDNDGDMVFCKFYRTSNDNITRASLAIKYAQADDLLWREMKIEKNPLDEVHIKVDNYNKRYFVTSFSYTERRGNIDGFYFYVWDKKLGQPAMESVSLFTDELRKEARGESSTKMAFNDYFIRNIVTRRDGGFIIGSEAYYTTSRFNTNTWNRWNYLYGYPYMSSSFNNYYSPYYNSSFWNARYNNGQQVRFHADNITVLSFSNTGQLEWSNVMGKSQFDDGSDEKLSYQLMNTGGEIHFLFNMMEKRNNLLTDFSVSPVGEMTRNPTLKNLDKGYEFLPKYGKQVSARQMIIPCLYRNNYICFAKIDYN